MTRKRLKENTNLLVKVEHVLAPDTESRLAHAIDILLRSVVGELEGSIGAKKEAEPPQGSPLIEATERKDES
jgi:hypothetical protein